MCGITGIVLEGAGRVDVGSLARMTAALAHRGPDEDGSFVAAGVAFGHRRLSVVDLSPASAQPMRSPRGGVLTYNGEIYNARPLRQELAQAGRQVASTGDTEVLLAALETWGDGALRRIEGMFAFGYWDPESRSLLLARDRFGEKPLYYAPLGAGGRDGLLFASELRALLEHPRVRESRSVDAVAVAQYFLHEFVPAPRSILEGVRKLEAGQLLRWVDGEGVSVARYYEPPCGVRARPHLAAPDAVRELVRRTEEATRDRLLADVPVGVFLSGGLDSSFLAACATRVHGRVKTFNVAFDDASFDESAHARLVARHLGTEHREYRLAASDLLDLVPGTLDWIDEPFADSSLLPTTLLAREARRDVTVALGGEGGDELLAGYPTFVVDRLVRHMPAMPRPFATLAGTLAASLPHDPANMSLGFAARQFAQGLASTGVRRHASWLAPLVPEALASIAGPRLGAGARARAFDAVDACGVGASRPFDAATDFYLRLYLGEGVLTKVDRASMRASLEARAPLLDTGIVEFCLSLPESYRVRGHTTKWLMREAVRDLLPASIVARKKKGFGAPVGAWLRGPLRDLAEAILHPARLRDGGWLDPVGVSRMLDLHVKGVADFRKPLYAALVFEHWRQARGC